MLGYFFILATIFFLLSGDFNKLNINKSLIISMLVIVFALSFIDTIVIEYMIYINPGWVFAVVIASVMYFIMKEEHVISVIFVLSLSLLIYGVGYFVPFVNLWYVRGLIATIFSVLLTNCYYQAGFISVFAYFISYLLFTLLSQDLELAVFSFGVGDEYSGIIMALLLPMMLIRIKFIKEKSYEVT